LVRGNESTAVSLSSSWQKQGHPKATRCHEWSHWDKPDDGEESFVTALTFRRWCAGNRSFSIHACRLEKAEKMNPVSKHKFRFGGLPSISCSCEGFVTIDSQ
jgi:hypothetical protein